MIDLIKRKLYIPIFNFYDMLNTIEQQEFLSIPQRYNYNPYISKYYLNFVYEIVKFLKSSKNDQKVTGGKVISKGSKDTIDDSCIINQTIGCLKNVYDIFNLNVKNNTPANIEDELCYVDITNFGIDILLELISVSADSKVMSSEDQKTDYSVRNIVLFNIN